jgi:enterochelin esterase-like enzyme
MENRFAPNATFDRSFRAGILLFLSWSCVTVLAHEKPESVSPEHARANFAPPVVLAADDVRVFPDAPAGFNHSRAGGLQGRVEAFAYDSTVTSTRCQAVVYFPPQYSPNRKYPVLYLLHGIAGNEWEWSGYVHADVIIDNLIADGKATPMIVVMPNVRALADDRPPAPDQTYSPHNTEGFAKFERDLLDCLIPSLQARYSVRTNREQRALAGLSMGGSQTLNFGLKHLDTLAWVGGFSSAPTTRPPAELLPDPAAARTQLRLLYLSSGNHDGLISVSQGVHTYLKQQNVPHIWNVDDHGNDGATWGSNIYYFAQRIFIANLQP